MPPRFAYWTILAGGLPTSFRAADKDELMPTFRRLKEKHPDAEMKYFARGQLWDSAEDARRARRDDGPRGGTRSGTPAAATRGRDWRPGGDHRDPRQPFKDAKRARNQQRRQERWTRQQQGGRTAPAVKPHGDPLAPRPDRRTGVQGSRQGEARRPGGGAHRKTHRPAPRVDRVARTPPGGERQQAKPRAGGRRPPQSRPFRSSNERGRARRHDAPRQPPRPDREPPPGQDPKPEPPPRPSEPAIKPPGPPERGRGRPDGES